MKLALVATVLFGLSVLQPAYGQTEGDECEGIDILSYFQKLILETDEFVRRDIVSFCNAFRTLLTRSEQLERQLESMKARLEAADDAISSVRGDIPRILPAGAIAAFDLPGGCPAGWTEFVDGVGKVLIGAGKGRLVFEDGAAVPLTERKYRGQGGEETAISELRRHGHTIRVSPHTHDVKRGFLAHGPGGYGFGGSSGGSDVHDHKDDKRKTTEPSRSNISISETGGTGRHNNMPPYIALYFCKKL